MILTAVVFAAVKGGVSFNWTWVVPIVVSMFTLVGVVSAAKIQTGNKDALLAWEKKKWEKAQSDLSEEKERERDREEREAHRRACEDCERKLTEMLVELTSARQALLEAQREIGRYIERERRCGSHDRLP